MEQVHYIHCPPTQQLKKKDESVVVNEKVQKDRHRFLCASSFVTMEWGGKKTPSYSGNSSFPASKNMLFNESLTECSFPFLCG